MQITAHHPDDLEQLRQRSRQQRNARQRDRYRAVVLALLRATVLPRSHGPWLAADEACNCGCTPIGIEAWRRSVPNDNPVAPASCRRRNNPLSENVSWAVPPPTTASARCGRRRSDAFSGRNSPSSIPWRECMICCIVWAFPAWPHVPVTARTIPPKCSNGSNKPPFCPNHGPATPRPARAGLVPG